MNRVNPDFTLPYGSEKKPPKDITAKEAEDIYKAYCKAFPGLMKWLKKLNEDALKYGHVITPSEGKILAEQGKSKESKKEDSL